MNQRVSPAHFQNPFAALDDPQEWSRFSRASPCMRDQWESMLQVDGMVCATCAGKVEQALRALPGVASADVSAARRSARVVWSATSTSPSALFSAVLAAGFAPLPANSSMARAGRLRQSRLLLWRWLVAGLCMMQVMMYAYPAYVAVPGDLAPDQAQVLRWASWVLTLPVMAFSCMPFFQSAWKDTVRGRVGMDTPVALAILITFASSTAGTFNPGGIFGAEVYFDSLTMFVFFLLSSRWLELRLRDRTAGSLEALANRLPESVQRRVIDVAAHGSPSHRFEQVAARQLRPGDVIRVRPGEAFSADGVVLEGHTHVDESLLTGESRPLARGAGEPVAAGSFNRSGAVLVQVTQLGADTRYAQIVSLMETAATTKPAIAVLADSIAGPFLWVVLLAALAAAAVWWAHSPQHALMVGVAVLIVTCPCALSLATPAAMMAASGALARAGVLVRRPQALEALVRVNTFVFDKTGTLTADVLVVGAVKTRADTSRSRALALAAALAAQSLHPASRAIVAANLVERTGAGILAASDVQEIQGMGLTGSVRAAGCLRLGSASHCQLDAAADGDSRVHLSDGEGWLASFDVVEKLRPDALAAVQLLQALGCEVEILSGDRGAAVARVARQLGIERAAGDCRPEDKLSRLRQLQQSGRRVAMVGDGLNDGPALAVAEVSIAMGRAVPVAHAQADLVVQGDQLAAVAQAVLLARKTVRIVRQNLGWAALYNLACIPLAALGFLPAWLAGLGMASSSLLVVLNSLRLGRDLHQGW